jgi:hypothetical protein
MRAATSGNIAIVELLFGISRCQRCEKGGSFANLTCRTMGTNLTSSNQANKKIKDHRMNDEA